MGKHVKVRKGTVALATVGGAVLMSLSWAAAAQAMPGDHPGFEQYCTPDQVDVALVPLDSGMGKSGGAVRFSAEPGQSCMLGGAPVLTFEDSAGQGLKIPGQYPTDQGAPVRVDAGHSASASFSFPRVDGKTGRELHGPVPTAVRVALPVPGNASTVDVPWSSGAEVPGPVDVTPVLSR